jgi:uncharacterized protein with HEPN domain
MPRDPRAFLWDVRSAADKIANFVRGKTVEEFTQDELLHSAVERQLEIIGEALSQLTKAAPDMAGRIEDLPRIVGLRNILIHGYAIVKRDLIWRAVRENLPGLRAAVDRLLESSDTPPD